MMQSKDKQTVVKQFSKHCAFVPQAEDDILDDSLHSSENRVFIRSAHGIDVRFHSIVKTDASRSTCFDSILTPLLERTIAGESTTAIYGGSSNEEILSHALAYSAAVLLQPNTEADMKSCRVTFSWFNIDCESSELLVDVLKAASNVTNPSGGCAMGKSTELYLREAGHGKGVAVPGLLEIEICKDGDLTTLLQHLQATVPHVATFATPSMHSVFQLTFSNLLKKKPSQGKDFVAMGSISDMLDVGKITFIKLSEMVSNGPPVSPLGVGAFAAGGVSSSTAPLSPKRAPAINKGSGRSKTEDIVTKGGYYPWVEHAKTIVQWIESKRAATPFHKSRLMLLLKDVLLRRQRAALLLMLQPSAEQHQANLDWLRLVALLSRTGPSSAPTSTATTVTGTAAATANQVVTSCASHSTAGASTTGTTSTTSTRRKSTITPASSTSHGNSPGTTQGSKMLARRRSSSTDSTHQQLHQQQWQSSSPARRASVKTQNNRRSSVTRQLPQQDDDDDVNAEATQYGSPVAAVEGDSAHQSPSGSPHNNNSSSNVLGGGSGGGGGKTERRGSRLFRSTAKLLDLPESVLLPVPTVEPQTASAHAKVSSLTPKEISMAMRELSLRNKKAAKIAAMELAAEQLPDSAHNTGAAAAAAADHAQEIEELKKRLAAMEEKCRALEVENVQLIMTQQSLLQAAAETSASAASSALVTATEDEKQPTEGAPASTATGPPAPPALDTLQTAPGTDADRLSLEEQLRRALDRIRELEEQCAAEAECRVSLISQLQQEVSELRLQLQDVTKNGKVEEAAEKVALNRNPNPVAAVRDSSSDSDSDSEKKVSAQAAPAKSAPVKAVAKKASSSSSDSDSSSGSDSDPESEKPMPPAKKANVETPAPKAAPAAKATPATPLSASSGTFKAYVKGLPWTSTEDEVAEFFVSCGTVSSVELPLNEDGRSSGTANVFFTSREELDAAIALDGQLWPGTERWLMIVDGDRAGEKKFGDSVPGERPEGCDTLFVGNMPRDIEESQLYELFGTVGEVSSVRFATSKEDEGPSAMDTAFTLHASSAADSATAGDSAPELLASLMEESSGNSESVAQTLAANEKALEPAPFEASSENDRNCESEIPAGVTMGADVNVEITAPVGLVNGTDAPATPALPLLPSRYGEGVAAEVGPVDIVL